MIRHNLHVHSTYSDGILNPRQLIKLAKKQDIKVIGISDHAFTSKVGTSINTPDGLKKYIKQLKKIKSRNNDLDIRIGVEIDFSPVYGKKHYHLPFKYLNKLDYVLYEYVNIRNRNYDIEVGFRSIEELIEIRKNLDIPVGLAHNDLQYNFDGEERQLAEILSLNDIFIELNQSEGVKNKRNAQNYYRLFSYKLINELKRKDVKFTIGTDFHKGPDLDNIHDALDFVQNKELSLHRLVKRVEYHKSS